MQDTNDQTSAEAPAPTASETTPTPGAVPVVPEIPTPASTGEPIESTSPLSTASPVEPAPVATPAAQATAAATAPAAATVGGTPKNHLVAILLSIFLGNLGIDRFYLGHIGVGIAKLLLCWLTFGIWWIIDIILIATKHVKNVTWES